MKLSEELIWRGFKAQTTVANITDLDKKSRRFYLGVDPSQESMTIGNLAALMMCKVFIKHGYESTLLVGGATGRIGDPKMDKERTKQTPEQIDQNAKGIHTQYMQIMGQDIPLVNNYDWFKNIKYIDFLDEVGTQFSMTQLLDREFVKARIGVDGSGISYAEFSYSLIQGYDFLHLFRTKGIDLQLCGADQFGNCVSGMHLIKRLESTEVDVWSCPLILDSNGNKFGKSEGNAIWLSEAKTSAYNFYQFWLNVDDEGVESYLKVYTELDEAQIEQLLKQQQANPGARIAQKALAYEVTKIVHGQPKADSVVNITTVLFGDQAIDKLSATELDLLAREIPTVASGLTVVEILLEAGLVSSNGEARRLLESGAISVNGAKVHDNIEIKNVSLVKKGKNSFVLVK
ncbi:tyrosine--tRNA ligase [Candidatus Saccharibacteria bacterium]|nr:tyrosine--tRNA ligase [Candidatus Saccharibacteria bacterium]